MDWLRKVNNDNELQQLDACSTNDLVGKRKGNCRISRNNCYDQESFDTTKVKQL